MVCTQTTRAITIENCRGLTLRGLSIDYDPSAFTQGRIVSLSADKSVHEIEILKGDLTAETATDFKYQVFRGEDYELRGVDYYDLKVEMRATHGSAWRRGDADPHRSSRWATWLLWAPTTPRR